MKFKSLLYNILKFEIEAPRSYGLFHILFFCFFVLIAYLLIKFCLQKSDKFIRTLIGVCWIIMVILEIYKQVVFSWKMESGVFSWSYNFAYFPFQLCSTPLYVFPLVAFFKESKFRDSLIVYLGTFSFIGGFVVMIYPGNVFCSYLGVSIQTMIHHGFQTVLGAFLVVYYSDRLNKKSFLNSTFIFCLLVITAIIFNISIYNLKNVSEYFKVDEVNMFYLSPYDLCQFPVFKQIQQYLPYIFLPISYVGAFIFGSLLLHYFYKFICDCCIKFNFFSKNIINRLL